MVSKEELIADEVYSQHETHGEYPADRMETVLSAIYYCLKILVSAKGVDPKELDKFIGDAECVKPKKYVPPTEEELARQHDEKVRKQWKELVAACNPKRVE